MLEGRTLNERYKIRKMIGGGGMANVYLATDIILEREVAIKVLRLEYANDEEFIARFHREAQSATSLSHPNIVSIYDVGEEDGIYYMVMEYINGMTLKKYIQTYGPIEVEEAIDIMKQITSAITHAHANEIVHRDIKPQNILIDPYGQVKVTDFGIAVALSATSLTQTNSVLGSVHYLSPEQARGGMATKKSDVYSLGIVLFELLSGRLPFSGQSAVSIALKHLQSNTPSIRRWNPDLPQSVENIVLKATSKDPFHRYEHVYEIEDDLNTALSEERINEKPYSPPEDSGELTKAIPIITDDNLKQHNTLKEDTIVRTANGKDTISSQKKKNNKKKKLAIWITTTIVVLLGAIVAALFIIPNLLQPDEIEIPVVTELEYEEASDLLRNLGLDVKSEAVYSEEIPEGFVVRSDPEAGMTVIKGSTVLIFTSQGKKKVAFDNYVGKDFSQVQRLLQQSGYKVIFNEQYSDRPEGEIINQLHPQPGENVVPAETNVIFEVSRGRERVTLSQLVGMSVQDASDYLTREDLSVKVIDEQHSEDFEEGQVISQEPRALSLVEKGSVVEIVISLGPEEKPPITHPVTVTVPYEPAQRDGEQQDPQGQEIIIYVTDMNRTDEIVRQVTITEQTEFTLSLTIQPNGNAEYRVMRDGNVFESEIVSYEDVAGE